MANILNRLINIEDEAESNVIMANTVPIAYEKEERQMGENAKTEGERSTWTPRDVCVSHPGSACMGETVTIIVGPEKAKFEVQEFYLRNSEYLRTALNGRWREADDRTITLDDVEPEIFKLFANFIYTQKLSGGLGGAQDLERTKESWLLACIKAYALGDRLLAPKFCTAANNIFQIRFDGHFPASGCRALAQLAFAILPPSCIILQSIVDTYCLRGIESLESMLDAQNGLSHDFKKRVMRRLDELRKGNRAETEKNRCYWQHDPHSGPTTCPALHFRWNVEKEFGVFR